MVAPVIIEGLPAASISVTRELADICQRVQDEAKAKGQAIDLDTLAAGSPSEDSFSTQADEVFSHLHFEAQARAEGISPEVLWNRRSNYTSSFGPIEPRQVFNDVYGRDHGIVLTNPHAKKPGELYDRLVPCIGGTGGINAVFNSLDTVRQPYAALHTEPTYAGFFAAAEKSPFAQTRGVEMDNEGAIVESFEAVVKDARAQGLLVGFFYLVPIGDNPNGITYSPERMEALVKKAHELGVILVEDHPYGYIQYGEHRAKPLLHFDQKLHGFDGVVVHIFTASKIWNPGGRSGYIYSNVDVDNLQGNGLIGFNEKLVEYLARADLIQSPLSLWRFHSFMHEIEGIDRDDPAALRALLAGGQELPLEAFRPRSLWQAAERKLAVYGPMRDVMKQGLKTYMDGIDVIYPEDPDGFFFRLQFNLQDIPADQRPRFDKEFFQTFMQQYGVMIVPLYGFYGPGAAPYNDIRLAFSPFSGGPQRRIHAIERAVSRFGNGMREVLGFPRIG